MDLLGKLTGGQNAHQQTGQPGQPAQAQTQTQAQGGGGIMGMFNNVAGGGQQGEAKEGELLFEVYERDDADHIAIV